VSSVADTSGNGVYGDAGDTVNYSFTAENTGNTALAGVTVADTDLAALVGTFTLTQPAAGFDGDLAINEGPIEVATATYVLDISDVLAGGVTNTADVTSTAVATDVGGNPVPGTPLTGVAAVVDNSDAGSEAAFDGQDGSTTSIPNPESTGGPDDPTILSISNIVAVDDTSASINGASGGVSSVTVLEGDTLNGVAATLATVDITAPVAADYTDAAGDPVTGLTLSATTGVVTVAAGVPAGTYTVAYEICEELNPTNCADAEMTVAVTAAPIVAVDDTPPTVDGAIGATIPNIVANDSLNDVTNPTIGSDVTINGTGSAQSGSTLGLNVTPAVGGIVLDPNTGVITVDAGTTAGTYLYTYEICEVLNPTNCATATVTVVVDPINLIVRIEEDLEAILEEDLVNTLTTQVNQISGYSADALDRLRQRSPEACLADVNARLAVENVLFDTDKAIIKPESNQTLDDVAEILQSCEGASFEIAGHTDFRESDAYNIDLSQRRVVAVRLALAERGVDVTGYVARGYGEREPIASNATAEGMRLNRRVEFRPISNESTGHASYDQCEDSSRLNRNINMTANDSGVSAEGDFTQDRHNCITDRREVVEGSVSYIDTDSGQTQSAINLSYRREQYRGSESVFGYFVGLYGSRSEVTALANGEINGLGVNAGIYGAKRLDRNLFLDYYLGAAAGRHEFDLAFTRDIGVINANGDYTYVAGFAGAAISGEFTLGEAVVAPRVGFDYIYAPGADVDVIAELGGLSEAGALELDAISGGRVFAELRTDYLIRDGQANLWFNPRVACYQSLGNLDGACGFGAAIGIESTGENSELTYAVELDGEWGQDYSIGSITASFARQIGLGRISGDATMSTRGSASLAGNYEVQF
jgi:outer membrane protein OmpA-like peptidoglycan-associated protein